MPSSKPTLPCVFDGNSLGSGCSYCGSRGTTTTTDGGNCPVREMYAKPPTPEDTQGQRSGEDRPLPEGMFVWRVGHDGPWRVDWADDAEYDSQEGAVAGARAFVDRIRTEARAEWEAERDSLRSAIRTMQDDIALLESDLDRARAEGREEGAREEWRRLADAITPVLASLVHLPDRTHGRGDPGEDYRPETILREPVMVAVSKVSAALRDRPSNEGSDR